MNDEPQVPSLKLTLKRRDGADAIELAVPFDGKSRVVGRDPACDFHLDSPSLAPRHLELALTPKRFMLRDLGSVNGVHVDGRRLSSREVELRPGQEVVLGDFRFLVPMPPGAVIGPRPGSRNKSLLAILLVLVLVTVAAWLWKRTQAQESAVIAPPVHVAPVSVVSNAAVSVTNPPSAQDRRIDDYRRAAQLMQQGQYALYSSNDYLTAARLLNESIALDSRDTQALGLLRMIQSTHMATAMTEGMECLEAGDIDRARRVLERMKIMSPADAQVAEFDGYIQGEEAYGKATNFLTQGRYNDVISTLANARMLNEYRRQALVDKARRQLDLIGRFKQADDRFNAWQLPAAQAVCANLTTQVDLSFSQKSDLDIRRQLVAQAVAWDALLRQTNDVATIEAGQILLDSQSFQQFPGAWTIAGSKMDALRKRLAPDRERYEQDGRKAMADAIAAGARGDLYEAARLNSRALRSFVISDFVTPSSDNDDELTQLRLSIAKFTGTTFNNAYVLESRGSTQDAVALYLEIVEVAPSSDPYGRKARKRLEELRVLLPAEQGARGVIDQRIKSGEAILPAQSAPAPQAPASSSRPPAAPAPSESKSGASVSGGRPAGAVEVIPSRETPFPKK